MSRALPRVPPPTERGPPGATSCARDARSESDGVERVERTSRHRFEEEDLARTAQRETRHREQLADPGHDRDPHGVTARRAVDVGNCQRPLRAVVWRAGGVALEDRASAPLPLGDDDEVMVLRQLLQALRTTSSTRTTPPRASRSRSQARKLDPLIDDCAGDRSGAVNARPLVPSAFANVTVQRVDLGAEDCQWSSAAALRAQRGIEHALRRTHRPTLQRVSVAFRREGHRASASASPRANWSPPDRRLRSRSAGIACRRGSARSASSLRSRAGR